MKKELLMASALVSTMCIASVAEAVTASTSGHHDTGLQGTNPDLSTSDDTIAVSNNSSFSVSLSETTAPNNTKINNTEDIFLDNGSKEEEMFDKNFLKNIPNKTGTVTIKNIFKAISKRLIDSFKTKS